MAIRKIADAELTSIADAIRAKNGSADTYTPSEMPGAILAIPTGVGGGTVAPLTVVPSVSRQTFADPSVDGYKPVVVDAMPQGSEGTPTAQKGVASGGVIAVTPKVVNLQGYIAGGEKQGTPVTVSAAELVSGVKAITENGTYDVTEKASVNVNVPTPPPVIERKTISANGTYNPPSGVDGFAPVVVNVPPTVPMIESKEITANGTYTAPQGVDGYNPIVVNVPSSAGATNVKTWKITLPSNTSNGTNLITGDAWLAAHYNDPTLFAAYTMMNDHPSQNSNFLAMGCGVNVNIALGADELSQVSARGLPSGEDPFAAYVDDAMLKGTSGVGTGSITIGNGTLSIKASNLYKLLAGDYLIMAMVEEG